MSVYKSTFSKRKLTVAILLVLGSVTASASTMVGLGNGDNNFTMLDPGGGRVGGTNDVVAKWDGTFNTSVATAVTNMSLTSVSAFMGRLWNAHNIQVFKPGSYTFETCPGPIVGKIAADGSRCNSGVSTPQTMVVGKGQVGVHMLFDWNGNKNIDVINVWNVNSVWGFGPNNGSSKSLIETGGTNCRLKGKKANPGSPACQSLLQSKWLFTATDPDGNGVAGTGMVDGPFLGFNAAFNIRPQVVPVPGAIWLLGSGLLGLLGMGRRRRKV